MTISSADFKAALGHWASGVTVVTTCSQDGVHGMTVSAFCSLSLEPPLVLICAGKAARTHGMIEQGHCFAVNVLADDQQAISNRFAKRSETEDRFSEVSTHTGVTGAPLLDGTAVSLDCTLHAAYSEGDHTIYVGKVEHVEISDRTPLLYYQGQYGTFAAQ